LIGEWRNTKTNKHGKNIRPMGYGMEKKNDRLPKP